MTDQDDSAPQSTEGKSTGDKSAERKSASERPHDPAAPAKAKEELFEAIEHFRNAASILFDRATKDPAVRHATTEAERVIQKVGATAEPLARSLVGELAKLTRQVADAVDGRRKSEVPPPPKKDE